MEQEGKLSAKSLLDGCSGNRIGGKGAEKMGEALKTNAALTKLSMDCLN